MGIHRATMFLVEGDSEPPEVLSPESRLGLRPPAHLWPFFNPLLDLPLRHAAMQVIFSVGTAPH